MVSSSAAGHAHGTHHNPVRRYITTHFFFLSGRFLTDSWGSGADLWGTDNDARFGKPRIDDGVLEVVGVTGVVHMVSPCSVLYSTQGGAVCVSRGHVLNSII